MEWKTISIFVSSTCQDMHAERDILREYVFPAIEEKLQDRHHHLEVTDLRWGVFTDDAKSEAEREIRILSVCMSELTRTRPFFLALLGDRYGWVPPEGLIERVSSEIGLAISGRGKSITELEIEVGALNPPQPTRPLVYIRSSLPVDQLTRDDAAMYSDAAAGKLSESAKLDDLKRRLQSVIPERVRRYSVRWDSGSSRVTDVDQFGSMVLEDLWHEIDVETSAYKSAESITQEDEDRSYLASFVEHRLRNFVGRDRLIEELTWKQADQRIVTISGASGSGKSALFAQLYRIYENREDLILLAHAAGAGPRGSSIDSMVLRFAKQLASRLNLPSDFPDSNSEKIDHKFAEYFERACTSTTIILLIDAIDQFEKTERARYITWFPRPLPTRFLMIVTGLPCTAMEVLSNDSMVESWEIPPLNAIEAKRIAQSVCGQYHRRLSPQILSSLLANCPPDGCPSYSNPLWLTLAAEQLNLVRSDDYFSASRLPESDTEKRLITMLSGMAANFPSDVNGMCSHLLTYLEGIYGHSRVSAFASIIALGRPGWRERDLRALLSSIEGSAWTDLDVARVRRAFRGQLMNRGNEGFLGFFHKQMYVAVAGRYLTDPQYEQKLNSRIADYLKTLREGGEFKGSGLVYNLIMSQRIGEAIHYLVSVTDRAERKGAVKETADLIVRLEAKVEHPGDGALSLLANVCQSPGDPLDPYAFALELVTALDKAIENRVSLEARKNILESSLQLLPKLTDGSTDGTYFKYQVAAGQNRLADVLGRLGREKTALPTYEQVLIEAQRLVKQYPADPRALKRLAMTHFSIGETKAANGDFDGALTAFEEALRMTETAASLEPESPMHQAGISAITREMGRIYLYFDMLFEAHSYSERALLSSARAVQLDPDDEDWEWDLSGAYVFMGNVLEREGRSYDALDLQENALYTRQKYFHRHADNPDVVEALAISFERVANLRHLLGNPGEALTASAEAVRLRAALAKHEPNSPKWGEGLRRATELHKRLSSS